MYQRTMRTTIDSPDHLLKHLKARDALEGRTLRDVVVRGRSAGRTLAHAFVEGRLAGGIGRSGWLAPGHF